MITLTIRRACSYVCRITPPEAPSTYSAVLVTIQQNKTNLLNKSLTDLTVEDGKFVVKLTQEETALLTAGVRAWMQIRCYAAAYNVPGSAAVPIDVLPALNDEILGGT